MVTPVVMSLPELKAWTAESAEKCGERRVFLFSAHLRFSRPARGCGCAADAAYAVDEMGKTGQLK